MRSAPPDVFCALACFFMPELIVAGMPGLGGPPPETSVPAPVDSGKMRVNFDNVVGMAGNNRIESERMFTKGKGRFRFIEIRRVEERGQRK